MDDQNFVGSGAGDAEDPAARGHRSPGGIGFWVVTGAVALAVGLPFLIDPAGAWQFWLWVSAVPTGVVPG